jgi:hypothetical protein
MSRLRFRLRTIALAILFFVLILALAVPQHRVVVLSPGLECCNAR